MEILRVIRERKSIRKFKSELVSKSMLEKILIAAHRSPSAINTQPWECWVVGGGTVIRLAGEMYQAGKNREVPHPDFQLTKQWKEVYINRVRENGKRLFSLLGIDRQDQERRKAFNLLSYRFYDAPQIIFVVMDESLGYYSIFDCGCFVQTVCLVSTSMGLGTCILESAVHFPNIIRKYVPIPKEKKIIVGIAIGYPDNEATVNQFISTRDPLDNFVKWQDVN
jgi:nitroreductase